MGDVNINTSAINKETSNYLSDLCDTFSLQNKTSTDIKLKNWSRNFYETEILGIGLRDNHKLIFSFFPLIYSKDTTKIYAIQKV